MFANVLLPHLVLIYRICEPAGCDFPMIEFELIRPIGSQGGESSHSPSPIAKKNQSAGLFRKLAFYLTYRVSIFSPVDLATYHSIDLPTYQPTNVRAFCPKYQATKVET